MKFYSIFICKLTFTVSNGWPTNTPAAPVQHKRALDVGTGQFNTTVLIQSVIQAHPTNHWRPYLSLTRHYLYNTWGQKSTWSEPCHIYLWTSPIVTFSLKVQFFLSVLSLFTKFFNCFTNITLHLNKLKKSCGDLHIAARRGNLPFNHC